MYGTLGFCFSSISLYSRSLVFACSCSCFRVSCQNKVNTQYIKNKLALTAYCAFIYCMLFFACVNSAVTARRLSASALAFLLAELQVTKQQVNVSLLESFSPNHLLHFGFQLYTFSPALIQILPAFLLHIRVNIYTTFSCFSPYPLTNLDSISCWPCSSSDTRLSNSARCSSSLYVNSIDKNLTMIHRSLVARRTCLSLRSAYKQLTILQVS